MEETKSGDKTTPKPISPAIQQILFTDLGNYGEVHTGIDKDFYLMRVIDGLTGHLITNYGEKWFYETIEKELKNTPLKFKTWQDIYKAFEKIKPHLNKAKIYYDDLRGKKDIPKEKQVKIGSLAKKITPYQFEIYFVFNIMMKISGIQRHTIPMQYFRSVDKSKYVKTPLERSKPTVEQRLVTEEEARG